ncbi:MAG: hypothetical protein ACFB2W_27865 [Leptolyngbyaceae cyanobacterium]
MAILEADVALRTRKFLKTGKVAEQSISRLYTDAHSTLLTHKSLSPFQRFTVDLGDFVMHPDLVGQLTDGETLFAIEAQGTSDLIKGLA